MSPFQRPPFIVDGRVVARRDGALTMGERVYRAGEQLSPEHRAELSERQLGAFWQQGLIDTLPPVAATPPAAKPQQQQQHQHRR